MAPDTHYRTLNVREAGIDAALRRLAPTLSRIAAATAGSLLGTGAMPGSDPSIAPRPRDLGEIRCSQRNIGETHEMVMDLSVDKAEWNRLFAAGEPEDYRMDAFRELVNCICGGLIAEAAFTDEFGYLIPCVPYAGSCAAPADSAGVTGAFRLGGAWIRFTLSIHQASDLPRPAMMAA
jgi:hypothetical protein